MGLDFGWKEFCPMCLYYDKDSGNCSELHFNLKSHPKKFYSQCGGKYYRVDTTEKNGSPADTTTDVDSEIEAIELEKEIEQEKEEQGQTGGIGCVSYIFDLAVFFILLYATDIPWIVAFIISEIVGWSIRALYKMSKNKG